MKSQSGLNLAIKGLKCTANTNKCIYLNTYLWTGQMAAHIDKASISKTRSPDITHQKIKNDMHLAQKESKPHGEFSLTSAIEMLSFSLHEILVLLQLLIVFLCDDVKVFSLHLFGLGTRNHIFSTGGIFTIKLTLHKTQFLNIIPSPS